VLFFAIACAIVMSLTENGHFISKMPLWPFLQTFPSGVAPRWGNFGFMIGLHS
jgi:hypothetical protein